jgi:hypothetical protein
MKSSPFKIIFKSMKTKEERANDKIPKNVGIYLVVEISHSSRKMPKKEESSPIT